ncbi:protein starmaker-like [Arachis ipaensis]|uniref:protein starmaker-like n=1 Tax=Arachis ipaensis TaxID=130454 RepID=UPI0007AF089A|nr:protein starmaker-like [Arachis ipaensis]XP_025651757.1 protein starmaker-like [Arachis hypogaea]
MEGPPMTFVFHHGGLFKKNAEGDMPCIVDQIEEEVVNVEAERLKQGKYFEAKKCSSQPMKKPTTIDPQSNKQTSHRNRTTSQPKSQPNPTIKPISEPNQPKVKPMSQPNKPAHQPKKTTSQPKKTTTQPMKPDPQAKKTSYQAKSVPPQSNSPAEAANNSQGAKDKQSSSGCRVTRSGREVKEAPLQEDDTNSHDPYESTDDELYRPPKVVGDNLYSSDSDSDSGNRKRSGERASKSEVREKHKPPKKRLADKEIDTDDSNYEGSEDEQSSESDLEDSDGASDVDSWHSEDSDKVLESDEESPAVYPQFNEKTKFGQLKFEVNMYFDYSMFKSTLTNDYVHSLVHLTVIVIRFGLETLNWILLSSS